MKRITVLVAALALCAAALCGCTPKAESSVSGSFDLGSLALIMEPAGSSDAGSASRDASGKDKSETTDSSSKAGTDALKAELGITELYHDEFIHGEKGAEYQKYIVLHDTEGESDPESVVSYWAGNGKLIAAHFIVGRDGSVVQCVPMDKIAHHVGFGDTGHNAQYGVEDESRDDKAGTSSIGSWASDYGMNSYSIGIEMVHMTGGADYTEEQLLAVDKLIAYIDAYYGFESQIIDHKDWRTGNSDTSEQFSAYLENYKATRTHTGQ